jgi:hypothetical protein
MTVSHGRVHAEATAAGHAAAHATGVGSVILELGEDIGVFVLHAPARLHGTEVEISPESGGPHGRRTHSLVRERVTASGIGYAAVYPDIPAGRYTIWGDDGVPVGTAVISGGQVASFRWPG